MSDNRIYIMNTEHFRKFIEPLDEEAVRLVVEVKSRVGWRESHSTPISAEVVRVAAKLLNISVKEGEE